MIYTYTYTYMYIYTYTYTYTYTTVIKCDITRVLKDIFYGKRSNDIIDEVGINKN